MGTADKHKDQLKQLNTQLKKLGAMKSVQLYIKAAKLKEKLQTKVTLGIKDKGVKEGVKPNSNPSSPSATGFFATEGADGFVYIFKMEKGEITGVFEKPAEAGAWKDVSRAWKRYNLSFDEKLLMKKHPGDYSWYLTLNDAKKHFH